MTETSDLYCFEDKSNLLKLHTCLVVLYIFLFLLCKIKKEIGFYDVYTICYAVTCQNAYFFHSLQIFDLQVNGFAEIVPLGTLCSLIQMFRFLAYCNV